MPLKNKRILITAGPTWVSIDAVRVISNTASARTGILLAGMLEQLGAKVTLLLGPAPACSVNKTIKVIRFYFFDQLKDLICAQLKGGGYDAVIHSAAVSDYRPKRRIGKKIASGIRNLRLDLCPTEKIIEHIKKYDPSVYLVGFKFRTGVSGPALLREAAALARRSRADIVVANTAAGNKYRAYIVKDGAHSAALTGKAALARRLCRELETVLI